MIAQEVQKILPDAVSTSGPYQLNNGEVIEDLLIVDKDRLFLGKIFLQLHIHLILGSRP